MNNVNIAFHAHLQQTQQFDNEDSEAFLSNESRGMPNSKAALTKIMSNREFASNYSATGTCSATNISRLFKNLSVKGNELDC